MKEKFGASEGAVVPIVVGTWGGMPKFTMEDLKQLGIEDKSSMLTLSLIAFMSSIETFHNFMEYRLGGGLPHRRPSG